MSCDIVSVLLVYMSFDVLPKRLLVSPEFEIYVRVSKGLLEYCSLLFYKEKKIIM